MSLPRHKEKLIIPVPKSILGFIPQEVDLYDEARMWKLLSRVTGEAPTQNSQDPRWQDNLGDILADEVFDEWRALQGEADTAISVYEID